MNDMSEAGSLTDLVKEYQRRTGEDSLLVAVHDDEQQVQGIHAIGYDPAVGLLVDGKPPSRLWALMLEGFTPLQLPPQTLH